MLLPERVPRVQLVLTTGDHPGDGFQCEASVLHSPPTPPAGASWLPLPLWKHLRELPMQLAYMLLLYGVDQVRPNPGLAWTDQVWVRYSDALGDHLLALPFVHPLVQVIGRYPTVGLLTAIGAIPVAAYVLAVCGSLWLLRNLLCWCHEYAHALPLIISNRPSQVSFSPLWSLWMRGSLAPTGWLSRRDGMLMAAMPQLVLLPLFLAVSLLPVHPYVRLLAAAAVLCNLPSWSDVSTFFDCWRKMAPGAVWGFLDQTTALVYAPATAPQTCPAAGPAPAIDEPARIREYVAVNVNVPRG